MNELSIEFEPVNVPPETPPSLARMSYAEFVQASGHRVVPRAEDYAIQREAAQWAERKRLEQDAPPIPEAITIAESFDTCDDTPPLIESVIGLGHNLVISAPSKTGKTSMVMSLLYSLSTGEPFLGQYESTKITDPILYMNYELNQQDFNNYTMPYGLEKYPNIKVVHLRGKGITLSDDARIEMMIEYWKKYDTRMVIGDPLSQMASGTVKDFNDSVMATNFTTLLDMMKDEAGVSELVVVAHMGKAGTGTEVKSTAGSYQWSAWPDNNLFLQRENESANSRRFMNTLGRLPQNIDGMTVTMNEAGVLVAEEYNPAEEALSSTSVVLDLLDEYYTEHGRLTVREAREILNVSSIRMNNATLTELVKNVKDSHNG